MLVCPGGSPGAAPSPSSRSPSPSPAKNRSELATLYAMDVEQARVAAPTTVFVPGILGSQIDDRTSGRIYWGSLGSRDTNGRKTDAALAATAPPANGQMQPRPWQGAVRRTDGSEVDLYDPATWEAKRWGLFSSEGQADLLRMFPTLDDPRSAARDHVVQITTRARQLHEAPIDPPAHLSYHLFQGDSRRTPSILTVAPDGSTKWSGHEPGDGAVSRRSALLDERDPTAPPRMLQSPIPWNTAHFSNAAHFGIVADPQFLDNALFLLLQDSAHDD